MSYESPYYGHYGAEWEAREFMKKLGNLLHGDTVEAREHEIYWVVRRYLDEAYAAGLREGEKLYKSG